MASVARVRTHLVPRGLAPDPGLANLRIALRAALIQPLVLAFGILVLRNAQITLYMVFAVFSLLVFANFGGSPLNRLVAYAVTTLVGAVLVAIGSLASPIPAVAALTALVIVFVVEFAGAFTGYVAGSRFPLLLALVLAASVPTPVGAIPQPIVGWVIGGCIASAAMVWLWPLYEHDALRETAATAMRSVAGVVEAPPHGSDAVELRSKALEAVSRFQGVYRRTPYRPAGPTRRDRALAQLINEVEQARFFAVAVVDQPQPANPRLEAGHQLASTVVSVLEASAGVLYGGPSPDLDALDQARRAHRLALDGWAGEQLRSGAPVESVLEGLDFDHQLRKLAYHALAIGADAAIVAGREIKPGSFPVPYGTPIASGLRPMLTRVRQTVTAHLSWTSPVLHTSIRTAIGLAIGVLLARLFGLQHAFWVMLGTLSVLRSNALGTGRTTIQALVGTLLGFAVGGLFTLLFAHDPVVLWAALPVAVFLAAYAASAISFIAGQVAFTVLLLILFNLLAPTGWQVGLLRIEDVAVGTAIGLTAGVLLWPRGARSDFARNLSHLYRLVAIHIAEAINLQLGRSKAEAVNVTREEVWQGREKAGESFDLMLDEHGSKQLPPEVGAFMLESADHALAVADSLQVAFDLGYVASGCGDGARRLDSGGAALVASWFMIAERIDGVAAVRSVPLHAEELREAALDCLQAWKGEGSERGSAAIAVAWTREWIEHLGDLSRELDEPAAKLAASAAAPWWR